MLIAVSWNWAAISALATVAAAGGGLIALVITWHQVRDQVGDIAHQRFLQRQAAELTADIAVSQAYGQISKQMSEVHKQFLAHPQWIPYFYDGLAAPVHDAELLAQLEIMCESIMDFVDSVVEQRNTVPRGRMDWSTWESYFRSLYNSSPVLEKYVAENLAFYPDYLFAALGVIVVRSPRTGELLGTWHARELTGAANDPDDKDQVRALSEDRAVMLSVFGEEHPPGVLPATRG
jgi:hypothetical protein